jgi:predicted nuclease of predicted toxin-antitoxin system
LLYKIVADESVDYRIIKKLTKTGNQVISIHEKYSGITDKEVIKIAIENNAIIITEDKDFGELVFSHKEKSTGVILLRYTAIDYDKISQVALNVIENYNLYNKFCVLTINKIRIREI